MEIALLFTGAALLGIGVVIGVEVQRRVESGKSLVPFATGKPRAVPMDGEEVAADNYAEVRL